MNQTNIKKMFININYCNPNADTITKTKLELSTSFFISFPPPCISFKILQRLLVFFATHTRTIHTTTFCFLKTLLPAPPSSVCIYNIYVCVLCEYIIICKSLLLLYVHDNGYYGTIALQHKYTHILTPQAITLYFPPKIYTAILSPPSNQQRRHCNASQRPITSAQNYSIYQQYKCSQNVRRQISSYLVLYVTILYIYVCNIRCNTKSKIKWKTLHFLSTIFHILICKYICICAHKCHYTYAYTLTHNVCNSIQRLSMYHKNCFTLNSKMCSNADVFTTFKWGLNILISDLKRKNHLIWIKAYEAMPPMKRLSIKQYFQLF